MTKHLFLALLFGGRPHGSLALLGLLLVQLGLLGRLLGIALLLLGLCRNGQ